MNYFKFLASELRVGLQCDEPDPLLLDAIERLLSQAREIRDHLIKANMRLVMSIVKDFVTPRLTFDELLSEGTITLMQAVEKFDFDRGFRFSTYAYRSIARTAYRCVAASREEESRVTREADEWAYGQGDLQQSSSMSDQFWSRLRDLTGQMLQRLDRRERLIIRSRFALGSHRRVRSLQELANRLGVSKERVRQIEGQAVSKLRAMTKDLDLDDVHLSLD
jgi:RNA polymerase primary sigma factor